MIGLASLRDKFKKCWLRFSVVRLLQSSLGC